MTFFRYSFLARSIMVINLAENYEQYFDSTFREKNPSKVTNISVQCT